MNENIKFPSVEHIAWQVQDPEAVAAWYGEHFGFTVCRRQDTPAKPHFLADAAGRVVLEVYNNPKATVPEYQSMDPLHVHLAFAVDNPAASRDRLIAAGAVVYEDCMTTAAGDELAMLRDPWGFPLQLVKRKEPM